MTFQRNQAKRDIRNLNGVKCSILVVVTIISTVLIFTLEFNPAVSLRFTSCSKIINLLKNKKGTDFSIKKKKVFIFVIRCCVYFVVVFFLISIY